MARVLITGATNTQLGRRTQLEQLSVPELYRQALEDAGHSVDHKPCDPGMDQSEYDVVLMGMVAPMTFTCNFLYGALDVTARALAEGRRLVYYFDDWQTKMCKNQYRTVAGDIKHLIKPLWEGRPNYSWALEYQDQVHAIVRYLASSPWPEVLCPTFGWGDHASLRKFLPDHTGLWCVDPSSYAPRYPCDPRPHSEREQVWVSGALTEKKAWIDKWQHTWPLESYGHVRQKQVRLKERDLVQRYGEVAGTVCTPHDHAGSGWWRFRYTAAAYTGCLVAADPKEVRCLGDAFLYPAHQLETFTADQRQWVADQQGQILRDLEWPRERVQEVLTKLVVGDATGRVY